MSGLGRLYLERVCHAIGVPTYDGNKRKLAMPLPVSPEELARVLAGGRAVLLAGTGIGGLLLIVWLMMVQLF